MFDSVLRSLLHRSFSELVDAIEAGMRGEATPEQKEFVQEFCDQTRQGVLAQIGGMPLGDEPMGGIVPVDAQEISTEDLEPLVFDTTGKDDEVS